MSIETEGALNRLTAAVLALAIEINAAGETPSYKERENNVRYAYDKQLKYILRNGEDEE